MRLLLAPTLLCALIVGTSGCTGDVPTAEESAAISTDSTPEDSASEDSASEGSAPEDSAAITVPSLDISLRLPESFVLADDPELELLARSMDPRAVLTIARDVPIVVAHTQEPGERLSTLDALGDSAVVVENAVIKGLPPGVVANELLVANGDRSFSLILSSEEDALDALWAQLLDSIAVG